MDSHPPPPALPILQNARGTWGCVPKSPLLSPSASSLRVGERRETQKEI